MRGPDDILEKGRYRGSKVKDVPDSYIAWMIKYHGDELELWRSEQTRRALGATVGDRSAIDELFKIVTDTLTKNTAWGADGQCQAFVGWLRQQVMIARDRGEVVPS
jgi:hypothetical protein